MRSLSVLTLALILTMTAGCVSLPNEQELQSLEYGPYPENYEAIVKTYYEMLLKDPSSVQYRSITRPYQSYYGNRLEGVHHGYKTCVTLNAKNSYGAYVGFKTDVLLIRNGAVVHYVPDGAYYGNFISC